MNPSIAALVGTGAGMYVRKLMTHEVETILRRNGVDPRVAPWAAAGVVAVLVWAATK